MKGKTLFFPPFIYHVCSTSVIQILISDAYLCKILCHLHGKVINPVSCYLLFCGGGQSLQYTLQLQISTSKSCINHKEEVGLTCDFTFVKHAAAGL